MTQFMNEVQQKTFVSETVEVLRVLKESTEQIQNSTQVAISSNQQSAIDTLRTEIKDED